LTALYSKDAVLMPQGSPQPVIGSEEIGKSFAAMVKGDHPANMSLPLGHAKMLDPKTFYGGHFGGGQ
jgi:hypothetical protein